RQDEVADDIHQAVGQRADIQLDGAHEPTLISQVRSDYLKTAPERIGIVDPERIEAGGPRRAFDGRHDGRVPGEVDLLFHAADETAADITFVHEAVALAQLALGCELRHARARAGAAGTAIDRTLTVKHCIARVRTGSFRPIGPQHVTDAADRFFQRM